MFRHLLLASVALQAAFAGAALAQSSPGFVGSSGGNSSPLTAAALNSAFTTKQNVLPAINGDGTLNTTTGALTIGKIGGVSVNLGGAFSTSGAYTTTLTATGNTSVTLPTSGTLATQAYVTGQGYLTTVTPGTITQGGATAGQALEWSGSAWAPANTVNSITAGTGLTGGTITTTGTLALAAPGTATLGGVLANTGSAGQYVSGINTSTGALVFGTPAGTYTLPAATSSTLGGVEPDGVTIANTGGAISVGTIPVASVTGALKAANNLSDIASVAATRGNLSFPGVVQPVATRTGTAGEQNLTSTGSPGSLSRTVHVLPYGGSNLQVVLPGFIVSMANGEVSLSASGTGLFQVQTATVASGGSGYAAGDFVTMNKGSSDIVAAVLHVDAVSSGAVTKLSVVQPGAYAALQADAAGPASTTGSGTGLTVNFQWANAAEVYHIGIEPVWGTQSGILKAQLGNNYTGANYDMVVPYGATLVTDPVPGNWTAGAVIGVRTFSQGAPVGLSRYAVTVNGSQTSIATGNPPTDMSWSGVISGNAWQVLQPLAILGRLPAPATWALIIGDSIACGAVPGNSPAYDTGDTNGNIGWVERGLASRYPFVNFCRSADGYFKWFSTQTRTMREDAMRRLGDFTKAVVIDEMGTNDLAAGGYSAAQVEAWRLQLWYELQSLGVSEILTTTPFPQSTSTDSWATVANQSVVTSNAARQTLNTWLRSGAYLTAAAAYGVTIPVKLFDTAAIVESGGAASPSGKWNAPGYTPDGIHPNQATDVTIAASFPSLP